MPVNTDELKAEMKNEGERLSALITRSTKQTRDIVELQEEVAALQESIRADTSDEEARA